MSNKLSRRDVLKVMTAGAAGLVGVSLASASPRIGSLRKATLLRQTTEISLWVPPMWRYGADNKTITGTGSDDWITDAIARFEADHPGIKVNIELVPWDQWSQKTATGFASGDLPNVIYTMMAPDRIEAGLLEPLDSYVTQEMSDNWVPGAYEQLSINGHLYGLPAFVNPDMSAFSGPALRKHGGAGILEAVGEKRDGLTFDMMRNYGEEFSDGSSRYFFGVPTDHFSVVYWGFGQWLNGWGIPMWNEDETRWIAHEHAQSVEAMNWYVQAQNDWKILIPNLPRWSDVDNFYWNQNTAMRFQWAGIQTELEVAQEAGQAPADFDIVLAGFPHTTDVGPFRPNVRPNHFSVTATGSPAEREAAFTFANWLATDDSNATAWLVNGIFPATISGAVAVADHPFMEDPNRQWVLNTYLPDFPIGFAGWNWEPVSNARTSRVFNQLNPGDLYIQQFQSLLLGQKSAEQMLTEMSQRINGALGVEA